MAQAPGFDESLQNFLQAALSRGPNDELAISVLRESADLLNRRQPRGGALSSDQARFLIDSGDFTEEELAETEENVARGDLAEEERKTRLEALTAALSAAEVAEMLAIDTSRVRHRQAKNNLYAFLAGTKRRYPTWQFTGDKAQPVLPGLSRLIKAFPEDMQPATVQGFMSTPQEDLLVNDERVTPTEWLKQGGAPQSVVDILDSVLQS